jgi:hypothetical protein
VKEDDFWQKISQAKKKNRVSAIEGEIQEWKTQTFFYDLGWL